MKMRFSLSCTLVLVFGLQTFLSSYVYATSELSSDNSFLSETSLKLQETDSSIEKVKINKKDVEAAQTLLQSYIEELEPYDHFWK